MPFGPAFDEVEGVDLAGAVFLADRGKLVPMTKKQILKYRIIYL